MNYLNKQSLGKINFKMKSLSKEAKKNIKITRNKNNEHSEEKNRQLEKYN